MKKIIIAVMIVVIGLIISFTTGIIPGLDILDNGYVTENKEHGGISGTGELIGPNERKGFIRSYKADGFSETVTCVGKVTAGTWATGSMTKYRYKVYGKTDEWSDYDLLSKPGETSMYLSNPNPGAVDVDGLHLGGTYNADAYSFEFVGNDYKAVKVVFQGYIDWNILNPLDDGFKWRTLQTDEAYLYEGWGGLYLPFDEDQRPRSTFEIGEIVKIRVETTYGGQSVGEGKTWRVVLRDPNGDVYLQKDYGDNVDTQYGQNAFSFEVKPEMWNPGESNEWEIEIFNTLVPQGTLYVDTIDFLASAPGDVEFVDSPMQSKMGEFVSIKLKAEVNDGTQLAIDHFKVSVIYGTNDVLLPSDPLSSTWIIQKVDFPASPEGDSYVATVTFKPEYERFVTIHAKAYDVESRASKHTRTWTLWAYEDSEVPFESIQEQVGDDDYGGGHTDVWLPWDPGAGNWKTVINDTNVILAVIVFAIFLVITILSFFLPIPIPYGVIGRIIFLAIGFVISFAIYFFYGG